MQPARHRGGKLHFFMFSLTDHTGKKKVSFSISTIIPAATSEKTIQPAPSTWRLSLMNLKPMTKIRTVMAARATDMPTMAIQYNTSNNSAKVTKPPLSLSKRDGFITDKALFLLYDRSHHLEREAIATTPDRQIIRHTLTDNHPRKSADTGIE